MSLMELIAISGIFRKNVDLDILPPPPPFPEIGKESKKGEEKERGRKRVGLKKKRIKIEEIAQKPLKTKVEEEKLEVPWLEEIKKEVEKPEEVIKAEEEIQKAIEGMRVKKKPSIVRRLFKKKEEVKEKIETPEVMPRTYDKVDDVYIIEEKIHKARIALMDFKFDDAKRIYIGIIRMYNGLEQKKKAKVYQDIKDLYYERKSAEKFAKYK